jgi:hypothetical protein
LDEEPIWSSRVYPSRVGVRVVLALDPEHGVPVLEMREELTVFRGLDNPTGGRARSGGSPVRWKAADGETITRALQDAKDNPVERPLGRLAKSHIKAVPQHETADGIVIVPEDDESEAPKKQTARARSTPRFNICWSSSART